MKDSKSISRKISEIVRNESEMTDLELSLAIKNVCDNPSIHWSSQRLDKIIERRIKDFCKKNNFRVEDYQGVLPWKRISKI